MTLPPATAAIVPKIPLPPPPRIPPIIPCAGRCTNTLVTCGVGELDECACGGGVAECEGDDANRLRPDDIGARRERGITSFASEILLKKRFKLMLVFFNKMTGIEWLSVMRVNT